jgi:hypothetical protein
MDILLVIILLLALFGGGFGYRRGYIIGSPGIGIVGLLVIILIVVLLFGRV